MVKIKDKDPLEISLTFSDGYKVMTLSFETREETIKSLETLCEFLNYKDKTNYQINILEKKCLNS